MLRVKTPTDVEVVISFTFERQAKPPLVDGFKLRLFENPDALRCMELEGARDFMAELRLPNLPAFHDFVTHTIDPHKRLISHFEVNFVARHFVRESVDVNAIWTTDRNGSRRVDLDRADWVSAEGDYVRVSTNGESVLVHATLSSIRDRLSLPPFVQIHRSTLVQIGTVARVVRRGRRWLVEMTDGATHPIAKGRSGEILRLLEQASPTSLSHSSTQARLSGPVRPADRMSGALVEA